MHRIRIIATLTAIICTNNALGMQQLPPGCNSDATSANKSVVNDKAREGSDSITVDSVDAKEAEAASRQDRLLLDIATIVHENFNSDAYQLVAGGDLTIEEIITNAVDHISELFATARLSSKEYEQLLTADTAITKSLQLTRCQTKSMPSELLEAMGTKLCKLLMLRAIQQLEQRMQPQRTIVLNQFDDVAHKMLDT